MSATLRIARRARRRRKPRSCSRRLLRAWQTVRQARSARALRCDAVRDANLFATSDRIRCSRKQASTLRRTDTINRRRAVDMRRRAARSSRHAARALWNMK
eukprot:240174-Prymnesium_polylepis.1